MIKDVISHLCLDCDEVAFVWDMNGTIEINPCKCVDYVSDELTLDWME